MHDSSAIIDILWWAVKGLVAAVLGWFGYKIKNNDEVNAELKEITARHNEELKYIKEQIVSKEQIREIMHEEVRDNFSEIKNQLSNISNCLTEVRIRQAKVEAFQEVTEARAKSGTH